MKNVFILEDVEETRAWLKEVVREAFAIGRIFEAGTVRQGMSIASLEKIDVALIDLRLPDGSGIDVLRALHAKQPEAECIVTTVMSDDTHVVSALLAGAQGFLLKDQTTESLVGQLKRHDEGIPALSPSIARRIMEHFGRTGPAQNPAGLLTSREQQVLGLLGRGLRNAEVARELGLSTATIGSYVKAIYSKLGISSRAEAAWQANNLGLAYRRGDT